jgi:hypothetical protein
MELTSPIEGKPTMTMALSNFMCLYSWIDISEGMCLLPRVLLKDTVLKPLWVLQHHPEFFFRSFEPVDSINEGAIP